MADNFWNQWEAVSFFLGPLLLAVVVAVVAIAALKTGDWLAGLLFRRGGK